MLNVLAIERITGWEVINISLTEHTRSVQLEFILPDGTSCAKQVCIFVSAH